MIRGLIAVCLFVCLVVWLFGCLVVSLISALSCTLLACQCFLQLATGLLPGNSSMVFGTGLLDPGSLGLPKMVRCCESCRHATGGFPFAKKGLVLSLELLHSWEEVVGLVPQLLEAGML